MNVTKKQLCNMNTSAGLQIQKCNHLVASIIEFSIIFVFFYSESKVGSKSKGRRGAKNAATAAKVALMKLKLHAAGDKGLPQVKSAPHPTIIVT